MSKSAAIPADLQAYAGRAVELDGQLHDAAARLHMATQAFRDSSPEYGGIPEIKNDVQVVSDAWTAFLAGLQQANFDPTKLSPDLIQRFMSPAFATASARVTAYSKTVCGLAS